MKKTRWFILGGLAVALLLGGLVSYYASNQPDGLNKVAADKGFADQETDHATADSPFAGYATQGVDDDRLSGGLAVTAGVLFCFAIGGALFWGISRRAGQRAADEPVATGQK